MMIPESMLEVLTQPTPDALWTLRADLLEAEIGQGSQLLTVVDAFYHFLNRLSASVTAREYSHLASILDMAAVAGVAVQNLMEEDDNEEWWRRFVVGALSEGMMVLAARQYVKAWEAEMHSDYNEAIWFLAPEFWRLSVDLQPGLAPGQRRRLIEQLFAPFSDELLDRMVKAGLIIRLFQVLLVARLGFHSP